MYILTQSNVNTTSTSKVVASISSKKEATMQESSNVTKSKDEQNQPNETTDIIDDKLQQAISSLNEFLEINHNSSKFVYHEGLDRYFVQVINKDTEEVVKEIPPKKLLDAFYEMQKLVGMIVDEKI